AEQDGGDQLPVLLLLQEVALAEVRGMENLGRQVKEFLAVLADLPGPTTGLADAAVLLPDGAEHFDLEPAAAAGHIDDADVVTLPQERFGCRKVMPVLPDQRDELAHERCEQRLDQAVGH